METYNSYPNLGNFSTIKTEEVESQTGEKYIYVVTSKPYQEKNKFTYIDGKYYPDSHIAYLLYVVVEEEERNQETGKQLFQYFIKETQSMGAKSFYGSITNDTLLKWRKITFKENKFYSYEDRMDEDLRFTAEYEISEEVAVVAISEGKQVDIISLEPQI